MIKFRKQKLQHRRRDDFWYDGTGVENQEYEGLHQILLTPQY